MTPIMAIAAKKQNHFFFISGENKLLAGLCMIAFYVFFVQVAFAQDTIPPLPEDSIIVNEVIDAPIYYQSTIVAEEVIIDTIPKRTHSPLKATMLSATLPGLGQIYNGRTWKVPFIYAGYAGIAYALNFNNTGYQQYRRAWVARIDGNPNTIDNFPNHSTDQLQRATNYYRRNLEVTYIVAAALYVLNILDATVDAHLLDFDVGDDLSLNIRPTIMPQIPNGPFSKFTAPGLSLSVRF